MKIAQQLALMVPSFALAAAQSRAIAHDHVGGEGYKKFTFDDNSILIQSGVVQQYGLDADDAASIKGYAEWLGNDVEIEQVEIDRLLEALA